MPARYRIPSLLLLGCVAAVALPAPAAILRCTSARGAVTYQESPCPPSEAARVVHVPASFPAIDPRERERLFEREAALDRRLEARRERESREAIARAAQEAAAPKAQPEPPAQVIWIGPPILRGHRFGAPHRDIASRVSRRG